MTATTELIAEADDYAQRGWGDISDFAARVSKALKSRASRKPEAAPSDTDHERIARIMARVTPLGYASALALVEAETKLLEQANIARAASQPVQVEVTDDMVEKAAEAAYNGAFLRHAPAEVDRWADLVADSDPSVESWRVVARAALSAALGGGEPAPKEAEPAHTPPERDPVCVAAWPECHSFGYDPRCCRLPKSCSADIIPPHGGDHAE